MSDIPVFDLLKPLLVEAAAAPLADIEHVCGGVAASNRTPLEILVLSLNAPVPPSLIDMGVWAVYAIVATRMLAEGLNKTPQEIAAAIVERIKSEANTTPEG